MSLADWAATYAEMGWAVHPLKPGGKVPNTAHGCKDATSDVARVHRWWATHPNDNIGLATGVVFDVLDLDGPEGERSIDEWWEAVLPGWSRKTATQTVVGTPGGGQHWYGTPTGAGNRAGLLPSVDWRGRGGYVVAPPSVHPNGGVYEWLSDPTWSVLITWPQALVDLVIPSMSVVRPRWAPRRWEGSGHGTPYGVAGLEAEANELAGTAVGGRNHQLFSATVAVLELVAGGQLDEDVAVTTLTSAALHAGLSETEIATTIRSARNRPVSPRRPV